jgi:hypothetical protein
MFSRADAREGEAHRRLMAAVLQTVVDDCRGSAYRRARGEKFQLGRRPARKAIAYVTSRDRTWPFSFENLCEALGLSAHCLRMELQIPEAPSERSQPSSIGRRYRTPAR